MILKDELIGFIYQITTFKSFLMKIYQTNSVDLLSALYQVTYENEDDIEEILKNENTETIDQVAAFEKNQTSKVNMT